jgi:hypothetical protein
MRNQPLLNRQIELLRYLTDPALIFGGDRLVEIAQDPSLRGISLPHLRLEAEMSFDKRLAKIKKVFEQTFSFLGPQRNRIFREFVTVCWPTTYRVYDDGLCFYEFLQNYWRSETPNPPFIADLAKLELALARTRVFRAADNDAAPRPAALHSQRPLARLSASAAILQMSYDLRPIFEGRGAPLVVPREHQILVTLTKDGQGPYVTEVSQAMATVLDSMRDWKPLQQALDNIGRHRRELRQAVRKFAQTGVLDVIR